MTSHEDWLLQMKMKTSYTSEHTLLERKKESKKERKKERQTDRKKKDTYAHTHKRVDHRTGNQGMLG